MAYTPIENEDTGLSIREKLNTGLALADTAVQPAALEGYVETDDARLSDARTPTSHTHTVEEINDFPTIPEGGVSADAGNLLTEGTDSLPMLDPADLPAPELSNVIQVVSHGATASTARPEGAAAVYWIGTVEPTNATDGDLWIGGS
jgi:hypothetical protein